MLHDPARHEPLLDIAWDERKARDAIAYVVRRTEARFTPDAGWPMHPRDRDGRDDAPPAWPLYHGASGVIWALTQLAARGAATLARDYRNEVGALVLRNREWLRSFGGAFDASYVMGETGILLLEHKLTGARATADRLAALIASNLDNPTRELMWGSPGTMLAALFLHERTGEERFAALFRTTARRLWSQLEWSDEHACHYFTQDMYGQRSTYLDAVHGFVATASPLIRGRHLLLPAEWSAWRDCIENTVRRTATRDGERANWRVFLEVPLGRAPTLLMQFCHGAPGFVVCLAGMPGTTLDDLLVGGAEATWEAGPLSKGPGLCHGTAGNGYAFLKLFVRTGDRRWLARARAFAMHAIVQMEAMERHVGDLRHSLWTGDPGVALYLLDCIEGDARFPTLDVFD
ncbi:MAG TPA: LanC-like protein [Casimicrobiaceae bacterium]|nr:LanC-like protein [Casimicrobiaceae bacterium]